MKRIPKRFEPKYIKNKLSIFSSLNEELETKKILKNPKSVFTMEKSYMKILDVLPEKHRKRFKDEPSKLDSRVLRLAQLDALYTSGKPFTVTRYRDYERLLTFFGRIVPSDIKVYEYVGNPDRKVVRAERRLNWLNLKISQGKNLKLKEVNRYHRMCEILGVEIPEDIMQKFVAMPSTQPQKPKKIKKSKAKREKGRTYKTYIKSQAWEDRKNALFRERPRKCEICGVSSWIQVHHLRYDKKLYGSEPSEDLAILCGFHHQDYHDKNGVQKDCRKKYALYKEHAIKSYPHIDL